MVEICKLSKQYGNCMLVVPKLRTKGVWWSKKTKQRGCCSDILERFVQCLQEFVCAQKSGLKPFFNNTSPRCNFFLCFLCAVCNVL